MFILLSLTFLYTLFPNTCHVTLCKIISCDRIQTYLTLLRHLSYHLMKTDFVTLWRCIMWPYSYETQHFTYQMLLYTLVCVCVERGGRDKIGLRQLIFFLFYHFFFSILYSGAPKKKKEKKKWFFWEIFLFWFGFTFGYSFGAWNLLPNFKMYFCVCHRLVDGQLTVSLYCCNGPI